MIIKKKNSLCLVFYNLFSDSNNKTEPKIAKFVLHNFTFENYTFPI